MNHDAPSPKRRHRPRAGRQATAAPPQAPPGERTPLPGRSESTEDHLERIQELVEAKGYARVTDLAAALRLSRSAVSNMVRRLAARGFVNYERYRGFTLTPAGKGVAHRVRTRHRTLTEFLELLELDPKTVRREVEEMEHHLQPRTLAAFDRLVSYWKRNPEALRQFLAFHPGRRGIDG